jgi:hypothetical protein
MSTKASHGLVPSIKVVSTRAEVYFEDVSDGSASVRFVFPEGFNPASASHQLCNHIRAHLDELASNGQLTKLDGRVDVGDMSVADAELAKL